MPTSLNTDKKIQNKTKGKKKAALTPSKKTMNFARHTSSFNLKKMMPLLIVLAIVIVLFAKFGLIDQLAKKSDAYAQLSQKQEELAAYGLKLAEYDELADKYGRYSYGWMSEDEVSIVDRLDVIALIEKIVMSNATVENYSVNNNVVSINISGINLNEASSIVNALEADPLVQSVSVNSASAPDAETARIFMNITLAKEVDANEEG